jgi:hypothetical protein
VLDVAAAPYHINLDIAAIRPTELLEFLSERCDPRLSLQIITGAHQNCDPTDVLLRVYPKWPRRYRATKKRDKRAPLHVTPKFRKSIVSAQSSILIGAEKTGIEIIAAVHSQCRSWVILDRGISEGYLSTGVDFTPEADIAPFTRSPHRRGRALMAEYQDLAHELFAD